MNIAFLPKFLVAISAYRDRCSEETGHGRTVAYHDNQAL